MATGSGAAESGKKMGPYVRRPKYSIERKIERERAYVDRLCLYGRSFANEQIPSKYHGRKRVVGGEESGFHWDGRCVLVE